MTLETGDKCQALAAHDTEPIWEDGLGGGEARHDTTSCSDRGWLYLWPPTPSAQEVSLSFIKEKELGILSK